MMLTRGYEKLVQQTPGLQEAAKSVSNAIHEAVLNGGPVARKAADLLHGTWLGHPLHAVLTDVTVGAFSLATLFDLLGELGDDDKSRAAADRLTQAGVLSAVPTALSGMTDYSTIPKEAAATGALHGALNTVVLGLYLVSLRERSQGSRKRALALSLSAFGLAGVSAWLGGHLVYAHRVGVDRSEKPSEVERWTEATALADIPEGGVRCVEVEGEKVLLHRSNGDVFAIGAVCSHATGPLEEGEVRGHTVQCPWHDSVFDLRDGKVVHGPSVHPQPRYEARVRDGRVEVRAAGDE